MIGSIEEMAQPRSLLGTGRDLPQLVKRLNISELIIAYDSTLPADVFQGILGCYEQGVTIVPMPILYEQITGRVPIEHVGQAHWAVVLPLEGNSISLRIYLFLKRLIDIALSLIGLAIFAVLMIPLGIIMQLDSRGPLFFRQERTGRGGKVYRIVKLRSMIPDAEKRHRPAVGHRRRPAHHPRGQVPAQIAAGRSATVDQCAARGDEHRRPAPGAARLRRAALRADPVLPHPVARHTGPDGLGAGALHYGNTAEDALKKLQYDLYYIRHRSLTLDMLIMFRTLGRVVSMAGT